MVTVSATYGCDGSIIAPALAERLGMPFADRLIPARGSDDGAGADESVSEAERAQVRGRKLLDRLALLAPGMNLPTPDGADLRDQLRDRAAASIRRLVEQGGAVLLGRAGAVVLAELPGVFHVRLDGPVERRLARARLCQGIDEPTAQDRLTETDNARARYVQRLYGRDPADQSLYHLIVDPTVLSPEDCVDVLATGALGFWRHLA